MTNVKKYENVFFTLFSLMNYLWILFYYISGLCQLLFIVFVLCTTFRELAVPSPSAGCLSFYSPSSLLLISKSSHETIEEPLNGLLRNLVLEIFNEGYCLPKTTDTLHEDLHGSLWTSQA